MGFSKQLKSIMHGRGITVKELSEISEVPASTIYSILQRDSSRVDINSVISIAHALEVTADELLCDELNEDSQNFNLSSYEKDLIKKYRSSSPGIRESIEKLLDLDSSKKESSRILGA